jgi:hypothetical protein
MSNGTLGQSVGFGPGTLGTSKTLSSRLAWGDAKEKEKKK